MLVTKQIEKPIFSKNKFNVAPDDEMCKTCGKCCHDEFGTIKIIPIDFKEEKMKESLYWLMENNVLFIKQYNANTDGEYYEPLMLLLGKCCFLKDDGCVLSGDERPIACTHYGPKRLTKKRHSSQTKNMLYISLE